MTWPKIELVTPKAGPSRLVGSISDPHNWPAGNVEALVDWYHATMVPQLACTTDGSYPPHPTAGVVLRAGTRVVRIHDGEVLVGVWLVRVNMLAYPCAVYDRALEVFTELWKTTVLHYDYLWTASSNPVFAIACRQSIKLAPHLPPVTFDGSRMEWRKGAP